MKYLFAETRRHAETYALGHWGTRIGSNHATVAYVGSTTDLRGRPLLTTDDELHFLPTFTQHRDAKTIAGYASMTMGFVYPVWPKVIWLCSEPMHEWLPAMEAPVHDREELEAWLEA